jgi:ketosteroid isomerase-like protein
LATVVLAVAGLMNTSSTVMAADQRSTEELIRALEVRLAAATRGGDIEALTNICHPGYVAVPSDTTKRYTRDDLLRSVREDRAKYRLYSSQLLWITVSGNSATVGAQDRLSLLPDGRTFPYRSLRVYVRDGAAWTLRMAHSVPCEECAAE